jgi:hypothetical protein
MTKSQTLLNVKIYVCLAQWAVWKLEMGLYEYWPLLYHYTDKLYFIKSRYVMAFSLKNTLRESVKSREVIVYLIHIDQVGHYFWNNDDSGAFSKVFFSFQTELGCMQILILNIFIITFHYSQQNYKPLS